MGLNGLVYRETQKGVYPKYEEMDLHQHNLGQMFVLLCVVHCSVTRCFPYWWVTFLKLQWEVFFRGTFLKGEKN